MIEMAVSDQTIRRLTTALGSSSAATEVIDLLNKVANVTAAQLENAAALPDLPAGEGPYALEESAGVYSWSNQPWV